MLSSPQIFRRFCCLSAAASSPSLVAPLSQALTTQKKRLIFLGSPQVSTCVLDALFNASSAPDSLFEVAAIVTQPPSGRERGRKLMPSPVAQYALDNGHPSDLIFSPIKAGEESFLSALKALEPELCITAAYGNILPSKFLKIPSMGTVNIHPSLLPLYRGAAPVQRAVQDGVRETGVSVAYTVRQLDAGPVIACEKVEIDDQIKAPELLELLFQKGSFFLFPATQVIKMLCFALHWNISSESQQRAAELQWRGGIGGPPSSQATVGGGATAGGGLWLVEAVASRQNRNGVWQSCTVGEALVDGGRLKLR